MYLAGLVIGGLVGLAIAALILTSACSLVRVQPPDFFFAMVLCFMVGMVVVMIQTAAGLAATFGAGIPLTSLKSMPDYQRLLQRGAVMALLSTPLVSAGIYCAALRECSFKRGLLIWVAQFVVIGIFILGLWALIAGLGLSGR
jgi:hypothetical protein